MCEMESKQLDGGKLDYKRKMSMNLSDYPDASNFDNPSDLRVVLRDMMKRQVLNKANKISHDLSPQILNQQLQSMYVSLIIYQGKVYTEYKMWDSYLKNQEEIYHETASIVLEELKDIYSEIINQVKTVLEEVFDRCLERLETEFQSNINGPSMKDKKISNYIDAQKSSQNYLLSLFKEEAAKKLGDTPSEVFLTWFSSRMEKKVKDIIIIRGLSKILWQNHRVFRSTIYKDLYHLFKSHFFKEKIFKLFDERSLGSLDNVFTLFNIILLTNYCEFNPGKHKMYFSMLQKLYTTFMADYAWKQDILQETFKLIETQGESAGNQEKIDELLGSYITKWNSKATAAKNLIALADIFLAFNFVANDSASKNYTSHVRYMLKCLFKNLKNGEYQFTNFQILCCMESLVILGQSKDNSTILCNETVQVERIKMTISENLYESYKRTNSVCFSEPSEQTHTNTETDEEYETPNKVDHQEYLTQIQKTMDLKAEQPENFTFEKLSGDVRSKTVIICISGFTSEDSFKLKDWKAVCQAFPYTEVLSVNWGANATMETIQLIFSSIKKSGKQFKNLKHNFTIDWSELLLAGGTNMYQLIKVMKGGVWNQAYEEAVKTGVYLAHILAKTEIFKGYVVNLLGFSLGSVVVVRCLCELAKMGRNDIIYDVMLMGGVIHEGEIFKPLLDTISHKLINCYSSSDYILEYVLKMLNPSINPVGLKPILSSQKKVKNVDVEDWVQTHTKYRGILYDLMIRSDFNEDLESIIFASQ